MQVLQLVADMLNPLLDAVDHSFKEFEPLNKLAEVVKVRPAHIALTIFVIGLLALGTGLFSIIFVGLFGMVYPAYMTFKVDFISFRPWQETMHN